jgi:DNA-binding transcriptional LysR family regulator
VLPQWRAPGLPVTVLYAHRRQLPARLRVFMDWLAEVLAPYLAPPASAN